MTQKTKKQDLPAEMLILGITDEPYSSRRAVPVSKYHNVFVTLKPGQRIVCEGVAAGKIKHALDKWLHHQGHKNSITKATLRCPDGKGGVWWMASPPPPPATHWQASHNPFGKSALN